MGEVAECLVCGWRVRRSRDEADVAKLEEKGERKSK